MEKVTRCVVVFLAAMSSCVFDSGSNTSNVDRPEPISIGREWVFRSKSVRDGMPDYPDTLTSYSYCVCRAETTIRNKRFFIVHQTHYYPTIIAVDTVTARYYLHTGEDSVIVYTTPGSQMTTCGVFKRRGVRGGYVPGYDNSPLVNRSIATKGNPMYSDRFATRFVPLVFPLVQNGSWTYQKTAYGSNLTLTYLTRDTVIVPAGRFATWKVAHEREWLYPDRTHMHDWLTRSGVIKRRWDFGSFEIVPFGYDESITTEHYEIYEYYASSKDEMPAVKQMIPQPVIDSVLEAALEQWEFPLFNEWYQALWDYCDSASCGYGDARNESSLSLFIRAVWGDTIDTIETIPSYLQRAEFPTTSFALHDQEETLNYLVNSSVFVQGWPDCTFDWREAPKPFLDGVGAPYGDSPIRKTLYSHLYGRFD